MQTYCFYVSLQDDNSINIYVDSSFLHVMCTVFRRRHAVSGNCVGRRTDHLEIVFGHRGSHRHVRPWDVEGARSIAIDTTGLSTNSQCSSCAVSHVAPHRPARGTWRHIPCPRRRNPLGAHAPYQHFPFVPLDLGRSVGVVSSPHRTI